MYFLMSSLSFSFLPFFFYFFFFSSRRRHTRSLCDWSSDVCSSDLIVAGVLLGPNALGLVSDVHQVESLAKVGVILLLFTIGIGFSLSRLREMGRQVIVGGGAQVGLTVALSCVLAMALHLSWRVSLLLGFLVALSSTAIVLKGLTDKGEIDAPHGRLATGVLIFQDLCVVPM